MARGKNLSTAVLDGTGVLLYFTENSITFWASLIQIHYLYGSESFFLLLNFENDDSGLVVKCYSDKENFIALFLWHIVKRMKI